MRGGSPLVRCYQARFTQRVLTDGSSWKKLETRPDAWGDVPLVDDRETYVERPPAHGLWSHASGVPFPYWPDARGAGRTGGSWSPQHSGMGAWRECAAPREYP